MKHSGTLGVYVWVPLLMEITMGAPTDPEPLNPRTLIMKILKLAEPWFLLPMTAYGRVRVPRCSRVRTGLGV